MINSIMKFLGMTKWRKLPRSGSYGRVVARSNAIILADDPSLVEPCWVLHFRGVSQPVSFSKKPNFERANEIIERKLLLGDQYSPDFDEIDYIYQECLKVARKRTEGSIQPNRG